MNSINVGIFLLIIFFSSQGEGLPLLPGEKKEIEELLPATTSEEDKDTIFSILGQAMCRPTGIQVCPLLLILFYILHFYFVFLCYNNHKDR